MKKYVRLFAAVTVLLLLAGCGRETLPEASQAPSLNQQLTGPLSLGDAMPDLTVTTAKGETLTLSELLQQKKVVVLNLWYADCIWCIREFPVMEVAYQRYREDVEILALNPFDSAADIAAFQQEHSLSFPMASCSRDLAMALGVNGYPTSVVVDRDGVICMIHPGAVTDVEVFNRLFDTFTADDYSRKLYRGMADLFG
jgi:peroxiredoxin